VCATSNRRPRLLVTPAFFGKRFTGATHESTADEEGRGPTTRPLPAYGGKEMMPKRRGITATRLQEGGA